MIRIVITSAIITLCYSASGKATYYGGNPSGNACGYAGVAETSFPFGYYAACGGTVFNDGMGCGKCYRITCIGPYDATNTGCSCSTNTPSVLISCMDQCPECDATHFDLNPKAMERIVAPGKAGTCGVIETTIERVDCDYTGNIKIRAKSGTSAYWYGLHIDDVSGSGSITSVSIKSSGRSQYETTCTKGGGPSYWGCSGGFPLVAPLTVLLGNDYGGSIELQDCITNLNGGAEFDCGDNFGGGGTSPVESPVTSPVSAPTTPPPTDPPVDTSVCDGSSITVQNHEDSSQYWVALFLDNVCESCGVITNVAIRDNNNYNYWYSSTDSMRGSRLYYEFNNNGNAFTAPIQVRVTNSQGSRIINNAITSLGNSDTSTVDSGNNICGGSSSGTTTTTATTTTTTITTSSGGSSGNRMKITIKEGANEWWFALVPERSVNWIKIKDSKMTSWESGVKSEWDFYIFQANKPYKGPFSVKVKVGGTKWDATTDCLINEDVTPGESCYTTQNSAYNAADDTATVGGLNWSEWFAIIACILILIACIIAGVFYIKRRKKGDVSFQETADGDTPIGDNKDRLDGNKTKTGYDMSSINVDNNDNDDNDDEQEIEVEMNITNDQDSD